MFDDLGTREVKNIAEPVRVYGVELGDDTVAAPRSAIETVKFPASRDKPSIAVMPFANMSGDAEQEYFADGITEDLITDLSKISGLFVIARNSSFAFKGQALDLRRIGDELGVGHVLEGSVRKAGGRVRINAQLIDAATGGHLWAERYDGELDDIFTLQDEITEKIVGALKASLTPSEQDRAGRRLTNDIEAYDLFLQARKQARPVYAAVVDRVRGAVRESDRDRSEFRRRVRIYRVSLSSALPPLCGPGTRMHSIAG